MSRLPTFAAVLTCWQEDALLAARLLDHWAIHHPETPVLVVLDGPVACTQLTRKRDIPVHFHQGVPLASAEFGGAWTHRYMRLALEHFSVDYILKLDPDIVLTRPFKQFPAAEVFGQLQYLPSGYLVHGGCRGHQRSALERIVASELLLAPQLKGVGYSRFESARHPGEPLQTRMYQAEDAYLMEIFKRLNLWLEQWEEVQVRFRPAFDLSEVNDQYAVWHPVL